MFSSFQGALFLQLFVVCFSCSGALNYHWIILKKASIPVVTMLAVPLAKRSDLYDFIVSFRVETCSRSFFFFALFGSFLWVEVVYMFTLLYIVILSFTWI